MVLVVVFSPVDLTESKLSNSQQVAELSYGKWSGVEMIMTQKINFRIELHNDSRFWMESMENELINRFIDKVAGREE